MQLEHLQLITRLKQQPRLGMADDINKILGDLGASIGKVVGENQKAFDDFARKNAFGVLSKTAQDAYEKLNFLEKQNQKLSESFNVSTGRAAQLGYKFDTLAKTIGVNSDKLKKYAGELKSLFPGQAQYIANAGKFGEQIAKQTTEIRNQLGLSADAAEGFIKAQTLMGGASADNFKRVKQDIAAFSKSVRGSYDGAYTDIIESLGTMDAETVAVFGRGKDKTRLFQAALDAKKLGIELSKVTDIGKNSLNIEQSISDELELQILGAKNLNYENIRSSYLSGDSLAIMEEMTNFVKDNGEQFAKNPPLLEKAAAAFGVSNSELLEMYANLQANTELQNESDKNRADGAQALIDAENARRTAAGEAIMDIEQEETFLADKRSENEKQQDEAAAAFNKSQISGYSTQADFVNAVQETARVGMELQTTALSSADKLASALKESDVFKVMYGAKSFVDLFKNAQKNLETGGSMGSIGYDDTKPTGDLFIPAASGGTVVSGPFGSFALDERDDVLAAPNIRNATTGGSNTTAIAAAIVSALQGMSFHVSNVFDGDKIQSALQIRRGQAMNNLNNIS